MGETIRFGEIALAVFFKPGAGFCLLGSRKDQKPFWNLKYNIFNSLASNLIEKILIFGAGVEKKSKEMTPALKIRTFSKIGPFH